MTGVQTCALPISGRHTQYEKFYAGPGFVMNSYSQLTAPWKDWTERVDELLASYDAPSAG